MKTLYYAGLIIGAFTLVSLFACHSGHIWATGKWKHNPEKGAAKIAKQLGLDKEQEKQVKLILEEAVKAAPEHQEMRRQFIDETIRQLEADQFDREGLTKLLTEIEDDLNKTKEVFVKSAEEFHAVLTPEQREKLAAKVKKHKSKRGH